MQIQAHDRILFIGDSITDIKFNRRQRHKLHGSQIYALQAAKAMRRRADGLIFFFKGVASDRTYHVYDRLTKDCIDLKPDVIIMLIGVNDAWEQYVPDQYPPLLRPMEPHMREIYRRLGAELAGVRLMVLLPFLIDAVEEKRPFHAVLNVHREQLRAMAAENGAEIIDLQAVFDRVQREILPGRLAVDGVHPTNLGHKVIADAVLEKMQFPEKK